MENDNNIFKNISQEEYERLKFIDDLADEICKVRGIILPRVAVKILVLVYIAFFMNTFNIKYLNEEQRKMRPNVGSLITCQKGSGKSRALSIIKQVFKQLEGERNKIFNANARQKTLNEFGFAIPNSEAAEKEKEFKEKHGGKPLSIVSDASTSKALCEAYGLMKDTGLDNLLFNIDEAGDRIFKDGLGDYGTTSAKDFLNSINQLFDGYSGMGMSSAAKKEGIQSQEDVGANFIMVSTAEFMNDYKIRKKFQSLLEAGLGRRFLILNCPHIDEKKASRKRFFPDLKKFEIIVSRVLADKTCFSGRCIEACEDVWDLLENQQNPLQLDIPTEFLLMLFCVPLAAWVSPKNLIRSKSGYEVIGIKLCHWMYVYNLYQDIKNLDRDYSIKNTTTYDKVCDFLKEEVKANKQNKKDGRKDTNKVSLVTVKDFCVREKLCTFATFNGWFKTLCKEFEAANVTEFLITKNQTHVWLEENFAYDNGEKKDDEM